MPFVRLVGVCLPFSLVLLAASVEAAEAPPTAVTVEQVKAGELPIVLEYPARTAGYREVQVRAQVGGILQERTYQEGSRVQKD